MSRKNSGKFQIAKYQKINAFLSKKIYFEKNLLNNRIFKKFAIFKKIISVENLIIIFFVISILIFFSIIFIFIQMQNFRLINNIGNNKDIADYPYIVDYNDPEISAKSAVVYEKDSRVAVYKKNETFRFSPASSAKIMTAVIVLENYDPNNVIQVGNVSSIEGSKMNLIEGERIKIINLLYGLLLSSGNDAAFVLSNNIKGGSDEFVRKMNKKAEEIKLQNTFFADASGYSDKNYTTASDLVKLALYALQNKIFSKIVSTKYKNVFDEENIIEHPLINLNELLGEPGVTGVKTGFTNEAGGVLITSIEHRGKTFVIVLLKSEDRFLDTRKIISSVVRKVDFIYY